MLPVVGADCSFLFLETVIETVGGLDDDVGGSRELLS